MAGTGLERLLQGLPMTTVQKRLLLLGSFVLTVAILGAMSGVARKPVPEPVLAASKEEAKIRSVINALFAEPNNLCNVAPEDGRLLRILAETRRAPHVVEIGTCNGYSTLWFCLGIRKTGGRVITHEIDPYRVSLARENFEQAGVGEMVTIVQGNAHETVRDINEPIDILFIDADKDGYLDYLNKLLSLVRPGGLIIAHNTTDRAEQMQDFLKAITTNPMLETVLLGQQSHGMSITVKKRE